MHNMSGYGYVLPIWVGFWAQTSLKKDPFSEDVSQTLVGLARSKVIRTK